MYGLAYPVIDPYMGIMVGWKAFISAVIGMNLPGPGTIYVKQELNFRAPVRIGDTVTARVEVMEKFEKNRVRLKTTCVNQEGTVVLDGEAIVSPPKP